MRDRTEAHTEGIAQYLSVGELHVMKHKADRLAAEIAWHEELCKKLPEIISDETIPRTVPERREIMTDIHLAPAHDATSVPRRTWLALAVLILGIAMALLDTTIVNVALPDDPPEPRCVEATLSWIISGYALAYGLALIPAGRIGDRIGHKWVFVVGLTGFTVASLACGLAQTSEALIVARVAQGLFGGIFFPPVTALIQLMFPPRMRGKAFAIMGATIGFSTALGPLVGGLLIEALGETDGWRSIFFVNLPFGVIAVAAAILLLPRIVAGADARGVDVIGFVLVSGALVALLVPLIQGQDEGWPLWTYLSLTAALSCCS